MRKKDIERRLKADISNNIPDVLDNILIKCEKVKGFEDKMEKTEVKENVNIIETKKEEKKEEKAKRKFNFRNIFSNRLATICAMGILCVTGLLGYGQYDANYAVYSNVEFDVNPSVELEVNKKDKILEAIALNEDGKKIIEGMDLSNTDLNVAVNAIVGSMLKNGYITADSNSILVSVKNGDLEKGNKLQENISKEIESLLAASSINGAILTQMYGDDDAVKQLANDNSISVGKANLINQILSTDSKDANNNALTFEGLSRLNINELNLLLASKKLNISNITTKGNASEVSYIGRDKAKEAALTHAGLTATTVSRVDVDLDYDDGRLVYEVDFRNGNVEYEYEIDVLTGSVIKSSRENDGVASDSNYDDTDYGVNNDGITDYGDTDYGTNNDGVTDYADTDYGTNNDGVTDFGDATSNYDDGNSNYSAPVSTPAPTPAPAPAPTPTPAPAAPTTSNGNSNYDDGNSGYDSNSGYDDGNSGYDD